MPETDRLKAIEAEVDKIDLELRRLDAGDWLENHREIRRLEARLDELAAERKRIEGCAYGC